MVAGWWPGAVPALQACRGALAFLQAGSMMRCGRDKQARGTMTRRHFLQATSASTRTAMVLSAVGEETGPEDASGGLRVGIASYSLHTFPLAVAISMESR